MTHRLCEVLVPDVFHSSLPTPGVSGTLKVYSRGFGLAFSSRGATRRVPMSDSAPRAANECDAEMRRNGNVQFQATRGGGNAGEAHFSSGEDN